MRYVRVLGIVAVLAVVQGTLFLTYRFVEEGRSKLEPPTTFPHEQLPGTPLPDVTLHDENGAPRALRELRGKPVLLHFWATWCPPCKEELPSLLHVGRELQREGRLEVIAIVLDEDWEDVRAFFHGVTPPEVLRDATGTLVKHFEVGALPDTFLVNANGRHLLRFGGARDWRSDAARTVLAAPQGGRTAEDVTP
jgi:thiol-disulfide isomerase/thioredoxin